MVTQLVEKVGVFSLQAFLYYLKLGIVKGILMKIDSHTLSRSWLSVWQSSSCSGRLR